MIDQEDIRQEILLKRLTGTRQTDYQIVCDLYKSKKWNDFHIDLQPYNEGYYESDILSQLIVDEFIESLKSKHKLVVRMLLNGYRQKEIATHIRLSRKTIHYYVRDIRRLYKEFDSC
jgi:DNA-binding NarL/FixJ family response regulator